MSAPTPRVRMFAGPNGSGKSELKKYLRRELLGIYINPDEIEREIRSQGFLDLNTYGVTPEAETVLSFFQITLTARISSTTPATIRNGRGSQRSPVERSLS